MINRQEYALDFHKALLPFVAEGVITADVAGTLTRVADAILESYADGMANEMEDRYKAWESKMGTAEDGSLYSLGLRHARDMVLGIDLEL